MEASKARRLVNWLVDLFCVLFLFLALLRVLPAGMLVPEHYRYTLLGVMLLYYAAAELLFQRTIGKLFTGTRVVSASDSVPTAGQLLLRTVCRILPLEPLSLLFSQRRMAWHDRLSQTKVIQYP